MTWRRVFTTMNSNVEVCAMAKRTPRLSRLRTDRRGIELALGDLEAAVMKVIWQAGEPLPVEAVRQALEEIGRAHV